MRKTVKFILSILVLSGVAISCLAQEVEVFDRPSRQNDNWSTGPEVGERIPDFQAIDQNGNLRSFEDIKGPNGAYIEFYRSADW